MLKPTIAFIGAGNMASSLIGGLLADHYPADHIWATNPSLDKLKKLRECFNIHVTQDNRAALAQARVVVLAIKPAIVQTVVRELKDLLQCRNVLLISVVTGVSCAAMQQWAECDDLSIVRCMPNTPALLRCGITALYANRFVAEEQRTIAESILRAVGVTLWLEVEKDLEVVTAVSGSGPAYFFLVMEVMVECAKQMGLNPDQAELLTVNTALGAARMALESGKNIEMLRRQVASPGGTTEQAIKVFEAGGIRSLFAKALAAAKARAIEISHSLG